jgi:hypothetical protein
MKRGYLFAVLLGLCGVVCAGSLAPVLAQGVTTGSIAGVVLDANGASVPGVTINAVHEPSGTKYSAVTNTDGRFSIPNMRVGGGYKVTATLSGFDPAERSNLEVTLGVNTDVDFTMKVATVKEEITVRAESDQIFSSARTGAATTVPREALASLPTIDGRLQSVGRLTPQYGGTMSFAGQDSRMNNITVDGSYFNNSFGLRNTPGDTAGVAPISLASIEQIQINVAPYDVRQGNFVGAGVNTVTRSGTNEYRGSFYHAFRSDGQVGKYAGSIPFDPGTFSYGNTGFWAGGPIQRNKLFFFVNYEDEAITQPGTIFKPNTGGQPVIGNTTRVLQSDLDTLSTYVKSNFGYETGVYGGFDTETPAKRLMIKGDYNLNDRNKISFRYVDLDAVSERPVSTSSSLGFGRPLGLQSMSYQNSYYGQMEKIRSGVGEWNSILGATMSNNLIIGYTKQDESREPLRGELFPFVDILDANTAYISFGAEPFTPNNELRYNTFQIQNNLQKFGQKHSYTFGFSYEHYTSENVFYSGRQSVYTYLSLADFYSDLNGYLANPDRTTSPVTLRRFQVRYNNIPGVDKPIQPLEVDFVGGYIQDDWRFRSNVRIVAGFRMDVPMFGDTGFDNPAANALTFRDPAGNPVQFRTDKLPDANVLFSPRVGFNWDVFANKRTQVRGGTGIFTGRPAYVWISNQVGTNGVQTGFESIDNTATRPFHPDPDHYKPTNVTGQPAASYNVSLTEPGFKFPQIWRSNIAVDQRLPFDLTGTLELIHSSDVNGINYYNGNLPAAQSQFTGPDSRPRWVGTACTATSGPCVTRINNPVGGQVTDAVIMGNQSVGSSWNIAASLERLFRGGFFAKGAYSYGESKNTIDPGSVAFGSWNNNQHYGDPNNPAIGFAGASPGHRVFFAASYRKEYFSFGGTTVSVFWEARSNGNSSYVFSGDLNGDGGTSNDLIYIARDKSEMNFQSHTVSATGVPAFTATPEMQADLWEGFINQDPYLKSHRGEYVQRGAIFVPMVRRMDVSVAQDLFGSFKGQRHGFQFRVDILNFGNLLKDDWGLGKRLVSTSPLVVPTAAQGGPADAQGRPQYRLRNINGVLMTTPLEQTAGESDVYRIQFSLRYTFR